MYNFISPLKHPWLEVIEFSSDVFVIFFLFNIKRREEEPMPEECAVKVFKTTLNEFKTRDRYIKDDHRFRDRFSKQNPRKIIKLWAEKEMCNLSRFVIAIEVTPLLLLAFCCADRL